MFFSSETEEQVTGRSRAGARSDDGAASAAQAHCEGVALAPRGKYTRCAAL